MIGKHLNEGERMQLLQTIEGDIEPDSHDYVSNLKPRVDPDEAKDGEKSEVTP